MTTTNQVIKWLKEHDPYGKHRVEADMDGIVLLGPLDKKRGREVLAELEFDQ